MLLTWSLSRVPFSNKTGLPYVQRFGSNLAITLYLPFSFSSGSDSSLFESFFFAVCFCSESSCVATSFVDSAVSFCSAVSTIFSASALSCSTVVSSLFISLVFNCAGFRILYCLLLLLQYFHYSVRFLQRFFLCCFFLPLLSPKLYFSFRFDIQFHKFHFNIFLEKRTPINKWIKKDILWIFCKLSFSLVNHHNAQKHTSEVFYPKVCFFRFSFVSDSVSLTRNISHSIIYSIIFVIAICYFLIFTFLTFDHAPYFFEPFTTLSSFLIVTFVFLMFLTL